MFQKMCLNWPPYLITRSIKFDHVVDGALHVVLAKSLACAL